MELLTKELRAKLPKLYQTESTPLEEKTPVIKFFTPGGSWTYYPVKRDLYFEPTEIKGIER